MYNVVGHNILLLQPCANVLDANGVGHTGITNQQPNERSNSKQNKYMIMYDEKKKKKKKKQNLRIRTNDSVLCLFVCAFVRVWYVWCKGTLYCCMLHTYRASLPYTYAWRTAAIATAPNKHTVSATIRPFALPACSHMCTVGTRQNVNVYISIK